MQRFFKQGLIKLNQAPYLNLLLILAPCLNFLSGINIDLYAPSLPAIANYFSISTALAKNTITVTMIGLALGCIIFGTLIDIYGRRRVIFFGLLCYIIASFLAMICQSIDQLMLIRFIQGMMIAPISIGSRALIIDNFSGHRYNVGILYTSVMYSLGPIVAPFIGGILQYHFGWQANFITLGLFAILLFIAFILFVNEAFTPKHNFSIKAMFSDYAEVLSHKSFIAGVCILGVCLWEQLLYPTLASFLIENVLQKNSIVYGNSALIVGAGYLAGTLINRIFIKKFHLHHLTDFGLALLALSTLIQLILATLHYFNLAVLVIPIMMINFSQGFIFGNVIARCLKIFPNKVGIASAVQSFSLVAVASVGIFLVSHLPIYHFDNLAHLYVITTLLELFIFYGFFRNTLKNIP